MALKKILDMTQVAVADGTESLEVAIGAGLPNKRITTQQVANLAPVVNTTSLISSINNLPLSARPYFGFNARNNAVVFGGFNDSGSILTSAN